MTEPVRFGILGAANIARSFVKGVAGSALATVEAVASRGADKAEAFATELAIPRHHASYEALLEAESFARLVREGTGWNGANEAESLDTAAALAAIAKSARSDGWVDLPS